MKREWGNNKKKVVKGPSFLLGFQTFVVLGHCTNTWKCKIRESIKKTQENLWKWTCIVLEFDENLMQFLTILWPKIQFIPFFVLTQTSNVNVYEMQTPSYVLCFVLLCCLRRFVERMNYTTRMKEIIFQNSNKRR